MKQRLLTLLFALMGTMMSWGVNYNLKINNVQVTSTNASNLSVISGVSGTVRYDANTQTLYLEDATITGSVNGAIYSWSPLTINLSGTNTVTTTGSYGFMLDDHCTITGNGSLCLTASSSGYDIELRQSDGVTITGGASVFLLGGGGIDNDTDYEETLSIDGASLYVRRGSPSTRSIWVETVEISNSHLVLPAWSNPRWDGGELSQGGQEWTGDICIMAEASSKAGDVNGDGGVSLADVTKLVDMILDKDDAHEYVDLGLPSGTLWATCNVGANSPEEYGQCFMWGETTGHKFVSGVVDGFSFNEATVPYCNGALNAWTKYCTDSSIGYNGFTDGKTELELMDDAAYVNWGKNWRMPTKEQAQELLDYTKFYRTTLNDVEVIVIQSLINNKILYFPLTGRRNGNDRYLYNEAAYIWTRTLDDNSRRAWSIMWRKNSESVYYETLDNGFFRFYGFAIRPVRAQ